MAFFRIGRCGASAAVAFFFALSDLLACAEAQIRVMSPGWLVESLKDQKGRIEGSTSTFGAPFYGERILGRLVWGDSNKNHSHCTDDDYDIPPPEEITAPNHKYKEVRLINIVMVRRGRCSFVRKVHVARQKGAHAVVIVDTEGSKLTAKDIQRIIVADDGYGGDIDIPSMLISAGEGQQLIKAAHESQVVVELAWDVPTDHIVRMDLWMSSGSLTSLNFLKEFAPKRKKLNELVKFVPHYHVFGMQSKMDYNELCTDTSAQFCAEDPDGGGSVTGKMVIEEDVRQLCIHEVTKKTTSSAVGDLVYAEKFWDYVQKLPDWCPLQGPTEPEKRFGRSCSERLMKNVGIDSEVVFNCELSTKTEKLKAQRANAAWSPQALRINGWRYSGALDAELVTRAMCSAFLQEPKACKELFEPVNPFRPGAPPSNGIGFGALLLSLLGVALVSCVGLVLYKHTLTKSIHNSLREEVMLEVQAQMDTYKQLPP